MTEPTTDQQEPRCLLRGFDDDPRWLVRWNVRLFFAGSIVGLALALAGLLAPEWIALLMAFCFFVTLAYPEVDR